MQTEINIQILKDLLADISNFSLVVFGFCVTLYTVVYSFILNKKYLLSDLSELIKQGENIVLKTKKERSYISYINEMRTFNSYVIICLWFSLFSYVFSIFCKYFEWYTYNLEILNYNINGYLVYIILILNILILLSIIFLLNRSIKKYNKSTKI